MEEKEVSVNEAEAATEPAGSPEAEPTAEEVDYAAVLGADIEELKATFPELGGMQDIEELANPVRFGALRDLGLSAKEAYLASGGKKRSYDNRTHLVASVPGGARSAVDGISRAELDMARDIFGSMSESEIQRLYRKVTK